MSSDPLPRAWSIVMAKIIVTEFMSLTAVGSEVLGQRGLYATQTAKVLRFPETYRLKPVPG